VDFSARFRTFISSKPSSGRCSRAFSRAARL
jgi:hypothetical protein